MQNGTIIKNVAWQIASTFIVSDVNKNS